MTLRPSNLVIFLILVLVCYCSLTILVHAQLKVQSVIDTSGSIVYKAHSILYVDGTKLRGPSGEEVFLRAVQVPWNERMKRYGSTMNAQPGETTWFTSDDVRRTKESGGNCLEFHNIHLKEIMPERNVIDESFFTNWLDKWVSWCESEGIYYIINIRGLANTKTELETWGLVMPDWLWEGLYPKPTTMEAQAQIVHDFWDTDNPKQEKNRQAFINAWKYIADRYKSRPHALFGIINEPLAHTDVIMTSEKAKHLGETYSILITRVIDAIRNTGAQQVIFVDRPYVWGNVKPINRPNIVWEDHLYVTRTRDIEGWKKGIDGYVQRFVTNFGKPLFIGEFGIDPYSLVKETPWASTWRDILAEQVAYLDGKSVVGRQWHQWGVLEDEYTDYVYNWFTAEDSKWIIQTIYG